MSQENTNSTPSKAVEDVKPLIAPARTAFNGMIWSAAILVSIGVIMWIVLAMQAADAYSDEAEYLMAVAFGSLFDWATLAAPLFVGAGVVAGLGKREQA